MKLSKNSKKAGLALIGSMLGFIVAKHYAPKETYPFILIGGFLGNFMGEEYISEEQQNDKVLGHYENLYK